MAHKTPSKTEKHNPMQLYPHIVNTGTIGTSCPVIGRPVMHCPALALHRVPPRPKALRPIPCAKCPAPRRELPCTPARTTLHALPRVIPCQKSRSQHTRPKNHRPLNFLSSPGDFAEISAVLPCKRRGAPPRAPRGVAEARWNAGSSGLRGAAAP